MSRSDATTRAGGSPLGASSDELTRGVAVGLPERAGGAALALRPLGAAQRDPLAHAHLVELLHDHRDPHAVRGPGVGVIGRAPATVIWSSPFRHHVGASGPPLRAAQTIVNTPRVVGMA